MKFYLSVFLVLISLAWNAAANAKVKKKDIITIENGETGGVIFSFLVNRHCNGKQHFLVQKIGTEAETTKVFLKDKLKDPKSKFKQRYGLNILSPGKYILRGGECYAGGSNGYSLVYYDDIQSWFKPFEVKAGEILFLGTITHDRVSYKVDGVLDFIPDFISKPPKDEYRIYNIEDDFEDVLEKMEKKYSSAIPFVKKSLLELRMDGEVVKEIIKTSYKPIDGEKRVDGRKAKLALRKNFYRYSISGNW